MQDNTRRIYFDVCKILFNSFEDALYSQISVKNKNFLLIVVAFCRVNFFKKSELIITLSKQYYTDVL